MECFGTTDFDNNSRLITLSAIIISGLHCISCYSLYKTRSQFSRKVVDTVRSVDLNAPSKVASTRLLIATRFRLWPQATLFGQEPSKSNDIHLAVRVLP